MDVNDFLTPSGPRHRRASATDIANAPRTASDPVPITSNFTVTEDSGYQPGYTHYYTVTTTTPGVRIPPTPLMLPGPLTPGIGRLRRRLTITMRSKL